VLKSSAVIKICVGKDINFSVIVRRSLLEEKSKKVKDLEIQNESLEQELVTYEGRIIDMWKQHEDFILKT